MRRRMLFPKKLFAVDLIELHREEPNKAGTSVWDAFFSYQQ
jgi:hypothetical protein